MPANRRRYAGELAAPIVIPASPTFEGAATQERSAKFWRDYERHERKAERLLKQKLTRKLKLLMKHYGIRDRTDMPGLAIALAFAHVPGFKVVNETKTTKGRKRKWDGLRLLDPLLFGAFVAGPPSR
jgi:hypothetical protein